jgi:4-diphosphocytidyl-2-C-methyl-D-erythritol kinase
LIITEFARAKVNLALRIVGRRADGYHELDSLVAFAGAGDELRFEPAPDFALSITGPFAAALSDRDNLVLRAAGAMRARWPGHVLPARITLIKNLPVASGIGGGSADAAATLRGVARLSNASIDPRELAELALQLGADVPVCLAQKTCRMQGIGEHLTALEKFSPLPAILVNPGVSVATAEVFGRLNLPRDSRSEQPVFDMDDEASWQNDLEMPALALAPEIADVLTEVRRCPGLMKAGMSGSGATCYGLFRSKEDASGAVRLLSRSNPGWWMLATTIG